MFGNWGTLPAKPNERKRVLMQVKRIPAQIVCLAEAQELVEQTLRSPPSSTGAQAAAADALEGGPSSSTSSLGAEKTAPS